MKKIKIPGGYGDMDTTVRLLSVMGKPQATITRVYWKDNFVGRPMMPGELLYWVRLKNGVLLKDVTPNEVEQP